MDINRKLSLMKKSHEPSYSRGMVRLARKAIADGYPISPIVAAAADLKDPYYSAYALSGIGKAMHGAVIEGYLPLFKDACRFTKQVKPEWRRAEMIIKVVADMSHCGIADFSDAESIVAGLTEEAHRREAFRGLIRAMAKAGSPRVFSLLRHAVDLKEMSSIVKTSLNEYLRHGSTDVSLLEDAIMSIEEPYVRCKGLTYLGLKTAFEGTGGHINHFEKALKASLSVEDDALRLELLKYLSDKFISCGDIDVSMVISASETLSEISDRAHLLEYVAGKLSKHDKEGYAQLFDDALSLAENISIPDKKKKVLIRIARGMEMAGLKVQGDVPKDAWGRPAGKGASWRSRSSEDDDDGPTAGSQLETRYGPDADAVKPSRMTSGRPKGDESIITMGLFNTYEKKLSSAHVRAIARAAPLCYAYGLHLCLFNFPFKSAQEASARVIDDTSVGKGGFYLANLMKEGKFHVEEDIYGIDFTMLVATTSHPDPKKIFRMGVPIKDGNVCFLIGVGKKGLPGSVLSHADYHMELSGKNIPFETCTAIGIIAYVLKDLRAETVASGRGD